jgi:hypothetical protein
MISAAISDFRRIGITGDKGRTIKKPIYQSAAKRIEKVLIAQSKSFLAKVTLR